MSFCPVCGRDHPPGPCPISSVAPDSPDWEAKQYLRLSRGLVVVGVVLIVVGQLTTGVSPGLEIAGSGTLILGIATYFVSRRKRQELKSG